MKIKLKTNGDNIYGRELELEFDARTSCINAHISHCKKLFTIQTDNGMIIYEFRLPIDADDIEIISYSVEISPN